MVNETVPTGRWLGFFQRLTWLIQCSGSLRVAATIARFRLSLFSPILRPIKARGGYQRCFYRLWDGEPGIKYQSHHSGPYGDLSIFTRIRSRTNWNCFLRRASISRKRKARDLGRFQSGIEHLIEKSEGSCFHGTGLAKWTYTARAQQIASRYHG